MSDSFLFSSESVTEGHPDKVCDTISDAILDAHLAGDPESRVACEVLCKDGTVVVAGEICSNAEVDYEAIVRKTIRDIGYTDPKRHFHADGVRVINLIGLQSGQIASGVGGGDELGAGDQGLVFGLATVETPDLLPLPIQLAHALTRGLATARKAGEKDWLRPDAKSQVTVRYEDGRPVAVTDVVVSTQHAVEADLETVRTWVARSLLPSALGEWFHDGIRVLVNPAGAFSEGGPEGDCGVTGRKIIVDTYGGYASHGGGAFSGKDATKVDRSAAYFARYVARQIVLRGIAQVAELQIAYAIGVARPISVSVDTRGTGDAGLAAQFARQFDFRPAAIIERLGLARPIFSHTTNYGHFGKRSLPWEQ